MQNSKEPILPWICPYWPSKVCAESPSFHSQKDDMRKQIAGRQSGTANQHMSASCCQTEITVWSQYTWEESDEIYRAKESRHTVPSWTGKTPSMWDFQLQSHYFQGLSSGLKPDQFKLTQTSALRHQKTTVSPKSQSLAPCNCKQFCNGCSAQRYMACLYPALSATNSPLHAVMDWRSKATLTTCCRKEQETLREWSVPCPAPNRAELSPNLLVEQPLGYLAKGTVQCYTCR